MSYSVAADTAVVAVAVGEKRVRGVVDGERVCHEVRRFDITCCWEL